LVKHQRRKTIVGLPLMPATTLADCPANLDVLFVPGSLKGSVALMQDRSVLDFLARKAETARFVTSVCTGALVLGAAGLLRGYQATSHWYVRDLLALMGATVVPERVIVDRNRITGRHRGRADYRWKHQSGFSPLDDILGHAQCDSGGAKRSRSTPNRSA
jgi:putative intracellular protease/amidase